MLRKWLIVILVILIAGVLLTWIEARAVEPTVNPQLAICRADLDHSGVINFGDLAMLRHSLFRGATVYVDKHGQPTDAVDWPGLEGPLEPLSSKRADLNYDGRVNFADLRIIVALWGSHCEAARPQ